MHLPLLNRLLLAVLIVTLSPVIANEQPPPPDATISTLDTKPRWELGLGGGYVDDFDYPGSKDPNTAGLALPFFIYRGSNMRFSGRNLTAVAIEDSRFRFDFSIGAALNADSESDSVRQGMPDLDFLFEIGPQLVIRLMDRRTERGRTIMNWRNRLRGVFSTDFGSVDSQGWLFQSQLQTTQRGILGNAKLDAVALLNLTWAGEKLHDYFYQVDPEFVTANRALYDAKGGFLGTTLFAGLAYKPTQRVRLFGGVRQGYFAGTANEDSPLFETRSSTGFAVGFVWTLLASEEQIQILDDE